MPYDFEQRVADMIAGAAFARPADTTAYASGDLVANSTAAGSVVPISFDSVGAPGSVFRIERVKIDKTTATTTNASFRVHLFSASPISAAGDNAVMSAPRAGYLGAFDVSVDRAFSDGAAGFGVPVVGPAVNCELVSTKLYALIEARAAYAPGNAEQFTVAIEGVRF